MAVVIAHPGRSRSSPFPTPPGRWLPRGTEPQVGERSACWAYPPDPPSHLPSHLVALQGPLPRELSRLGELPSSAHWRPRMRSGRSAWSPSRRGGGVNVPGPRSWLLVSGYTAGTAPPIRRLSERVGGSRHLVRVVPPPPAVSAHCYNGRGFPASAGRGRSLES